MAERLSLADLPAALRAQVEPPQVSINVVGVGGAGGNVVNSLAGVRLPAVKTLAVNTDRQALHGIRADQTICLGESFTRGLGAGGDPLVGQQAAEESAQALSDALSGSDLVFIAAGMGGGTGTGAAPIVAQIARELGALTVALVTRPFGFEGRRRARMAEQGLSQLRPIADTVIVVPNDRLLQAAARTTSMRAAFGMADTVLRHGVQGLAELVGRHGMINVDFADVRAIMGEAGPALLGIGAARGPDRAFEAARRAMACPLLEGRLEGSRRLLLNIAGGEDLGLLEVQRAAELVSRTIDAEANIIFGASVDPGLSDGRVIVTLVATGFSLSEPPRLRRTTTAEPVSTPPVPEPRPAERVAADTLDLPPFLLRRRVL